MNAKSVLLTSLLASGLLFGCSKSEVPATAEPSKITTPKTGTSTIASRYADEPTPALTPRSKLTSEGAASKNEEASYSATISWALPTTRENGEALQLDEIAGYKIQYRSTREQSFKTILINDSSISKYSISNLRPGQYEIVITTVDTSGLSSEYPSTTIARVGTKNLELTSL